MHLVTSALLHVRSIAVKLIHGRGGEGEVGHLIPPTHMPPGIWLLFPVGGDFLFCVYDTQDFIM